MQRIGSTFLKLFPLWVVIFAAYSFYFPATILNLNIGQYVSVLLGIVMLGMGLNMSTSDFKLVLTKPGLILLGVVMRCVLMPLIAFVISRVLHLPAELAVGLILVGCCPSGTASNVMAFIAKGDTALSVTLTSVITLISPIITPLSFYLLAGSYIHVELISMFLSILYVVILPVAVGLLLHVSFPNLIERIKNGVPVVSVLAIIIIIMAVVAANANKLAGVASIAFVAVIFHNCLGLASGYGCSRLFGVSEPRSRAIAFEIGMENSGLAVVLVTAAGLSPVAAIPAAIFSVWHNLSGSLLAGYWRNKSDRQLNPAIHQD